MLFSKSLVQMDRSFILLSNSYKKQSLTCFPAADVLLNTEYKSWTTGMKERSRKYLRAMFSPFWQYSDVRGLHCEFVLNHFQAQLLRVWHCLDFHSLNVLEFDYKLVFITVVITAGRREAARNLWTSWWWCERDANLIRKLCFLTGFSYEGLWLLVWLFWKLFQKGKSCFFLPFVLKRVLCK